MTKTNSGAEVQLSRHLADRYSELRRFRDEAFAKYRAREYDVIGGPPVSLTVPSIDTREFSDVKRKVGSLCFYDTPPVFPFVVKALHNRPTSRILELGPGGGQLASSLYRKYPQKIEAYYGFDRDSQVRGEFRRLDSLDQLETAIDVVIASEVIEHMAADVLAYDILEPLHAKLTSSATFILSTPNPTSPGGIARDFSHVQNYPWYDLYAILRLFFDDVDVHRALYIYDPKQIIQLVPRIAVCWLLDFEWCNGLVCVATNPRGAASVA